MLYRVVEWVRFRRVEVRRLNLRLPLTYVISRIGNAEELKITMEASFLREHRRLLATQPW